MSAPSASEVAEQAVRRMQGDAGGALALQDRLPEGAQTGYQPALVLRVHCLRDLGKPGAGRAAEDAVGATNDPRVRAHLQQVFGIGRGK
jgi:hypothetical protein